MLKILKTKEIRKFSIVIFNFSVWLGNVHKYFGGGAGQLKIFVVKLFDHPFTSRQNFLNPPSTSVKIFLTPPPLLHL